MTAPAPTITGLVCTDDTALGNAVALLMHASGLQARVVQMVQEGIQEARRGQPEAVVIDAAVLGVAGVPALFAFLEAAPRCTLALVSPFLALTDAALAAGATAVVDPSDLRPLLPLLASTRVSAHEGYACTCCNVAPSQTAVVLDRRSSNIGRPESPSGLLNERQHGPVRGNSGTVATNDPPLRADP